jgi:hypothetical protein
MIVCVCVCVCVCVSPSCTGPPHACSAVELVLGTRSGFISLLTTSNFLFGLLLSSVSWEVGLSIF